MLVHNFALVFLACIAPQNSQSFLLPKIDFFFLAKIALGGIKGFGILRKHQNMLSLDPNAHNNVGPVVALFGALENANVFAMEHAAAVRRLADAAAASADALAAVHALAAAKAAVLKLSSSSKRAIGRGCAHTFSVLDTELQFVVTFHQDAVENEAELKKAADAAAEVAEEAKIVMFKALRETSNLGVRHSAEKAAFEVIMSSEDSTDEDTEEAPKLPEAAMVEAKASLQSAIRSRSEPEPSQKKRVRFE